MARVLDTDCVSLFAFFQFLRVVVDGHKADGEASTASHKDFLLVFCSHHAARDHILFRICLIVGVFCVGIYCCHIFLTLCKEREVDGHCACVLVGHTAHKPALSAFLTARCNDVFTRFGREIAALVPIYSHILDEGRRRRSAYSFLARRLPSAAESRVSRRVPAGCTAWR